MIGYETREELACEPIAKFWVRVIKREKRGSHCEEEQGVATAPAPAQIVPKGKLSNEFIIEVVVRKYQLHLPVYRQCAALAEDYGIELSRKTLTDADPGRGQLAGARSGGKPALEVAGGRICSSRRNHHALSKLMRKTRHNHRAFIWEFSLPGGIVIFEFQMGPAGRMAHGEF